MKSDASMKLLIVSADPRMTLGYSKVIQRIANYLASKDVEVVMYTVNYEQKKALPNVFIDPRIKLLPVKDPHSFGLDAFRSKVDEEQPDYVLVYACCNVVYQYIERLNPDTKVVVYIDICQKWADTLKFQKLKKRVYHWFTFLGCWRDHLVNDQKIDVDRVSVLEHGVNFDELKQLSVRESKARFGFDGFTVVNMNRNSLRKEWHTTIAGFVEFLSRHNYDPSIKLYVSCGVNDTDRRCDIEQCTYVEFMKRGLDYLNYTRNFILNTKPLQLTKEELNMLYCGSDVGINTCLSEGFGLTSVEHAYFNKPQVLTDIPTFRDTLGDEPIYMKPAVITTYIGENDLNGERAILDSNSVADALDHCYKGKFVTDTRDKVFKRFSWVNIHKQIDHMISILKNGSL
jgi:hypothetical protein